MKILLQAALSGAVMSLSLPVLACPGAEAQHTAQASVPQKDVVLTGVVTQEGCPQDAEAMSCTGYVLTADNNKGRFMITKGDVAKKLVKKAEKGATRVQVKGDVLDQDGRPMLHVATFKVMGNA